MRQAGRYLPEYRALRAAHGILEIIGNPELAATVTLQPLRRFDLDAAIIFADILPPLTGMGLELSFGAGTSPRIHNPIRSAAEVRALRVPDPREYLAPTLRALELVRAALPHPVALLGFAGAPFTLATYAIEGSSSRHFARTKRLMFEQPAAWRTLMSKLTRLVTAYLTAQVEAGAQAVQVFDSWAGTLGRTDFRAQVLPWARQVCAAVARTGAPVIYFSTGTGGLLDDLATLGCDVLSVDWRVDLGAARRRLPRSMALQGNLEPALLLGPPALLRARARSVLAAAADAPGFIFNLGHGVPPETPPEAVAQLVDEVHAARPGSAEPRPAALPPA